MPKRRFEVLETFTDRHGRVHEPPDPPLLNGRPPWMPQLHEYRRDTPLATCPALRCRRARACVAPLHGNFCQKTHMTVEAFRARMCDRIDAFMTAKLGDERRVGMVQPADGLLPTPGPDLKRALEARERQFDTDELRKWQKGWVRAQQENEQRGLSKQKAAR